MEWHPTAGEHMLGCREQPGRGGRQGKGHPGDTLLCVAGGSPLITAPPNKKLHHLSVVCSGSFPSNFGPKKPAQMFCI